MFIFDTMVDSVQTFKKQFVSTFVTNEKIAESLNTFIDSQTSYTKKAIKDSMDASTAVMHEMIKVAQESNKFDYTKFGEGIMKAYQANFSKK